jgi:hypothetical protein
VPEPISLQWRIANMSEVDKALQKWATIGDVLKAKPVSMGSPLIYAGPMNRGFFLSGPRAGMISRRRGPVDFMGAAKRVVKPLVASEIVARGRAEGTAGVYDGYIELARKAARVARAKIETAGAVRSGKLRDTLGVYVGGQRIG